MVAVGTDGGHGGVAALCHDGPKRPRVDQVAPEDDVLHNHIALLSAAVGRRSRGLSGRCRHLGRGVHLLDEIKGRNPNRTTGMRAARKIAPKTGARRGVEGQAKGQRKQRSHFGPGLADLPPLDIRIHLIIGFEPLLCSSRTLTIHFYEGIIKLNEDPLHLQYVSLPITNVHVLHNSGDHGGRFRITSCTALYPI